jgi:hypothetical protein
VVAQSAAQFVAVSPVSQVPLPHIGAPGQSTAQVALVSPLSHTPLPHLLVAAQGSAHFWLLAQVTMAIAAELLAMFAPQVWMQALSQLQLLAQLKKVWHLLSPMHAAHWLPHFEMAHCTVGA